MEEYIVITFDSTNFAMQTESSLKSLGIKHQIIPTPREITLSCGLSIRTLTENFEIVKELSEKGTIKIKKIFKVTGAGKDRNIKEIGE